MLNMSRRAPGARLANRFERKLHTRAKHSTLGLCLERWFPILGKRGEGLACTDGFAGPGRHPAGGAHIPKAGRRAWSGPNRPIRKAP